MLEFWSPPNENGAVTRGGKHIPVSNAATNIFLKDPDRL